MTRSTYLEKNLKLHVLKNSRGNQIFKKRILQRILHTGGRKCLLQTKGCQ